MRIKVLCVIMALAAAQPAGADSVAEALRLINAARMAAGCAPLVEQKQLMVAARRQSEAMAARGFFGHSGKGTGRPGARLRAAGYDWHRFAENIAAGQPTAQAVVSDWMKSAGHRRNILNCKLRETGLSVTYKPHDAPIGRSGFAYGYYWVQVFGSR